MDDFHTRQGHATHPPSSDKTVLRLSLACTECGTLRVFEVQNAIQHLQCRDLAHMEIQTVCEQCGQAIDFALFWSRPGMGYTYSTFPRGETVFVEDYNGMHIPMRDEEV